jgi:phage terminase large subunit
MPEITLPHNWTPRAYQIPWFDAYRGGVKRAAFLWCRRSGKDDSALHFTATQAMQRVGNYWHMLPQANQCRKAVWEAVNPHTGKKRIDEAFPPEIRANKREQDMSIHFVNGSTWQLVGSDSFDSLIGSPPIGLVFSEYSTANPRAWAMLRPILTENGGWAMFVSTPRGKNHFHKLCEMAKADPKNWFFSKVTALDSGIYTAESLEREKRELTAEYGPEEGMNIYRQEYECSFDAPISGAYYASIIDQLELDGHILPISYDPALPVTTAWDLGVGDATAIIFLQYFHTEIRVIDCLEASGEGLPYYVKCLKDRPYLYDQHIMPHDIRVRELGTGKSRYEQAQALGIRPITICRSIPVDDGINSVRTTLPRMYFDEKKGAPLLDALRNYRKEYDEVHKCYKNRPVHDWTSHFADALRMACVGYRQPVKLKTVSEIMADHRYTGVW